jgi:DNA-binding response OmpR family regulator
MTGLELAREVSRLRPGLPVILFTGYAEGISDAILGSAGAAALLHKPVDPCELYARLASVLPHGTGSSARASRSSA